MCMLYDTNLLRWTTVKRYENLGDQLLLVRVLLAVRERFPSDWQHLESHRLKYAN